jgi:hypothetical protein
MGLVMDERILKEFVAEVLTVCRWDDTGVTGDLVEPALVVAMELGMTVEEIKELAGERR